MGTGEIPLSGEFYPAFLNALYKCLGNSFWLGEEASVLAYCVTVLFFVEIAVLLKVDHRLTECMVLFGFMLSPAIHCSVTLRESFQALGFLGTLYSILKMRDGADYRPLLTLVCSLGILVVNHQSLVVFAAGLVGIGVPWALRRSNSTWSSLVVILMLCASTLIPSLVAEKFGESSATARAIQDGRILDYAASYRDNVEEARSSYGVKISSENIPEFAATSSLAVAMYYLAPLPWQVTSPIDLIAFLDVLVRIALIYGCIMEISASRGEPRHRRVFVFVSALTIESMWSLGTNNWGTAMRHHVVAFSAFVLVGLPYYKSLNLDPDLASLMRRRDRRKAEM